jgi:hypothetical protein
LRNIGTETGAKPQSALVGEMPRVPDGAGRPARPCEWCGAPVQQPETGRTRLHCKRSHRQRAFESRRLRLLREAAGLEPPQPEAH